MERKRRGRGEMVVVCKSEKLNNDMDLEMGKIHIETIDISHAVNIQSSV